MATAEQMAKSIGIEKRGISVLLWDAKDDLVHALLILNAALDDVPKRALLLGAGIQSVVALRSLIETRVIIPETADPDSNAQQAPAAEFWLLFLQQASYESVGPLLNGWRSSLREPFGTLLILRHADFKPFQRCAPDLASFVGPRIANASNLLSVFSNSTHKKLKPELPESWTRIIAELPGTMPTGESIREWITSSSRKAK